MKWFNTPCIPRKKWRYAEGRSGKLSLDLLLILSGFLTFLLLYKDYRYILNWHITSYTHWHLAFGGISFFCQVQPFLMFPSIFLLQHLYLIRMVTFFFSKSYMIFTWKWLEISNGILTELIFIHLIKSPVVSFLPFTDITNTRNFLTKLITKHWLTSWKILRALSMNLLPSLRASCSESSGPPPQACQLSMLKASFIKLIPSLNWKHLTLQWIELFIHFSLP